MEQVYPGSNNDQIEIQPQNFLKKHPVRKLIFLFSFMGAVPVFITFLLLFSLYLKYESNGYISRQAQKPEFQALPSENSISSATIETSDARINALDVFFARYNSPLEGHAQTIVSEADAHNIDYRLLPAIAMQESTLCKRVIKDSHNCWGFGIYNGKVTRFDSYDQAIKTITATLSKKYVQKGFIEPDEIVQKYTPGDTGKWEEVVSLMMRRIAASL